MKDIVIKRIKKKIDFSLRRFSDWLGFLFQVIVWFVILYILILIFGIMFQKFFGSNLPLQDSDFILLITAAFILVSTYETQAMKREMIVQNEIEQRPVLVLQITTKRDLAEKEHYKDGAYQVTHQFENGIVGSNYILVIRNIGKGPAMNISVSSKNFEVHKYEERIIAPLDGEYAIKITKRGIDGSEKIRNLKDLNEEVFSIYCDSLSGQEYFFDYKIINFEEKRVEFIELGKI